MELGEKKIIEAETFIPNNHEFTDARVRVRPVDGQGFADNIRVRFPRSVRNKHEVGTRFKVKVKLSQREDGSYYLNHHHSWFREVVI